MKPFVLYAAAGLGGISVAGTVGYSIRTILGLGGSSTSLALEHSENVPQSVPEPASLLLLAAVLLASALWHRRSIVTRLLG